VPVTVHETMIIKTIMRWLALVIFKFTGWKLKGEKPDLPKYIVIAAPHTSNWDFVYTVCIAFISRINPMIMMKNAWFFWPMGYLFRWLGAFPVDRSKSNDVVAQLVAEFHQRNELIMVVAPSGTRKKVKYWKTGFYHIANGANIPMVLGFLDYRQKTGGFGPIIHPTGDINTDMVKIRSFYSDVTGKHPKKGSHALIASKAELHN
jgi:1-acyl-sn-glycerol-3-phosphate acyltransferase